MRGSEFASHRSISPRGGVRRLRAGRPSRRTSAALVLALLLAGCGEEPPVAEEVIRPVKIVEVGEDVGMRREYPGEIRATQYSEMAFEVPGRIVDFPVTEGERVERGQVLARLDPRDYEAKVEAAEAKRKHAAVERDRARILYEKDVKPKAEYDLRARLYDVAAADARIVRKALDDTVLKAPFDGVLARKLVSDFRNVQAKEPVLIVQDDSSFEIKVSVPERDLTARREGRPSAEEVTQRLRPRVVLSSLPDQAFPARLTELAEVADPETRTFEATFAFDRPEQANVLGGMTAKVVLDVAAGAGARGIALPVDAVVSDGGPQPYVWVVDPATLVVSKRPVELGEMSGSDVELRSGVQPGDQVVASGVHQLRDGMVVRRLER